MLLVQLRPKIVLVVYASIEHDTRSRIITMTSRGSQCWRTAPYALFREDNLFLKYLVSLSHSEGHIQPRIWPLTSSVLLQRFCTTKSF